MKMTTKAYHGMEIEVKAKEANHDKCSKAAAQYFMNYVAILASEAANRYRTLGCNALAEQAEEFHKEIYDILEAQGLYDE